jgi:methionyl-tRNA formyltransferase
VSSVPGRVRVVVLTTGGDYGRRVLVALAERGLQPEAVVLDLFRPRLGVAFRKPRRFVGPLRRWLAGRRLATHAVGNLNDRRSLDLLRLLAPDLLLLGGARILSADVLAIPRLGALNAHPAHLPGFRGTGVVGRSILASTPVTVTVHFASTEVDAGDVVERHLVPIEHGDTLDSIQKRADGMCAALLAEIAARVASGEHVRREEQGEPGELSHWLSPDERRQAEQLVASGEVRRSYLAAADG